MVRLLILLLLTLSGWGTSSYGQYIPEPPGNNYCYRTIRMPDDYEGKVVCTLVKHTPASCSKIAILYIHGYNDYFFQRALGDTASVHGYNFYALDLRKYGRSILPGQNAFNVRNLSEYFADIDTALAIIKSDGNSNIVLMAHSTGGLITPLYLQSKGKNLPVKALVLNSPFLDMNMSWSMENIVVPFISFLGRFFPNFTILGKGVSQYAYSLLKRFNGEWDYNEEWKMTYGHPKNAGWVRAIHQGHKTVQKGLNLNCPILVLSSDKSVHETKYWEEQYRNSDIVLDVKDIQKYGARLGSKVTCKMIHGGMHDLILSPGPARRTAYQTMFGWLDRQMQNKPPHP